MSSSDARVVLGTAPQDEAPRIARTLVEEELAACINVLPNVRSFYWWEGEVNDDPESILVMKTAASRFEDLERRFREIHPDDVPECLALPVDQGAEAYVSWLLGITDKR